MSHWDDWAGQIERLSEKERNWIEHLRIQLAAEVEKVNKLQEQLAAEREKHIVTEGLLIEANKELGKQLAAERDEKEQYRANWLADNERAKELEKQLAAERKP